MLLIEVADVGSRGRCLDLVGVVKHHAKVADAADTGFRAHGRQAGLDAGEAERAFLRFAGRPVVVDFLVWAGRYAHAPAAALVLVDEDDAVLLALVDGAGRAGGDAGRVEAMLAQPRQIHHEGVFELAVNFLLDAFKVGVLRPAFEFAAQDFLPVRTPLDLLHPLAADQRTRAGRRHDLALGRRLQMGVVEGERFVVVVDFRQVRIGEDVGQDTPLGADARLDGAVGAALPAALPALLVLPILGIADAGLGLDVVEPSVFDTFAAGPDVLAGDGAGVTADALVEVQHHADLRADPHVTVSLCEAGCMVGLVPSSQSTLFMRLMTMNSSRLLPTVP